MKRKNFDKIVTAVGFGLTVFLFVAAGLLNWGASFASDSVRSQLENQNISFPAADAMPTPTKDALAKWAEMPVTNLMITWESQLNTRLGSRLALVA